MDRLAAMGPAAQASVPGVYAWAVTVTPVAWSRGAPVLAKVAAGLALLALVSGILGERRWGERARYVSLWGFVLASACVWSATPLALGPLRVEAPRGVAGMLGWALFALASAAPAIDSDRAMASVVHDEALPARKSPARGEALYVFAAGTLAMALQVVGWRIKNTERALLVRFVALAAGLAVIGAAADLALARHCLRSHRSRSARLRQAMAPLVALGMLVFAGVLFAFYD